MDLIQFRRRMHSTHTKATSAPKGIIVNLESLQKQVQAVSTPVDYQELTVNFSDGIVVDFATTYVSAMNGKLAKVNSSISFDETDMKKYLNTLLKWRIDKVNKKRVPSESFNVMVPSLFAISLTHVGTVYDKDLGISLKPHYDEDKLECMSDKEAIMFSRTKLLLVEDLGFELVEGLPKAHQGESDFMYFHMTDNAIVRHDNRAHPAYAVLAAFFRMKTLENVLTYRVNYGLISEYEDMLAGLIYDEAR